METLVKDEEQQKRAQSGEPAVWVVKAERVEVAKTAEGERRCDEEHSNQGAGLISIQHGMS
jgi:hypothetical protein